MPNLKSLRNRIRSVGNTKQITKAMKMVSAAKLRRAQERAFATRPYSRHMGEMMQSVAGSVSKDGAPALLAGRPDGNENRVQLVVFTADRGLCGGFNSSIVRAARKRIEELKSEGKEVSLVCIGSKGVDVLKRQYGDLIQNTHIGISRDLNFKKAQTEVANPLIKAYEEETFDSCEILFNTFKSAMTQEVTLRRIIPVEVPEGDGEEGGGHLFEPSDEEVLEALLPQNVAVQVFQALMESEASEQGARMTAMDSAVRNADEMIRKLTTTFNRTRQAAITTELMEIISGAESLKG
ncbi:MAG: F0F1 ATP synthase subunit gamma [Magnetococcales bacterium]|nr:F0F1 ATP synthase subunit gamma [Magnetococcales bacterium]